MQNPVSRADFFKSMYAESEGLVELRAIALTGGKPPARSFFHTTDIKGMNKFCQENKDTELYFGIGTRDGHAGGKRNIVNFSAVFCDIDFKNTPIEKANESLKYFPIQPSIVVHSGGGFHIYWLLAEPLSKESTQGIENILKRLAQYFEGDMGSTDAAHVLRIPGTFNHKPDYAPRTPPVKIVKFQPQLTYELGDFDPYLPQLKDSDSSGKAVNPTGWEKEVVKGTTPGHRRPNLAREAGRLIQKGLVDEEILPILLTIDKKNTPPVGKEEVIKTLKGIRTTHDRNYPRKNEINVTENIRGWIDSTEGEFFTREVFEELNIPPDKKSTVSKILTRLVSEGLIERAGRRTGCFRRIEKDLVKMDIFSAPQGTVNIMLPFEIDKMVKTREGEIIVVAGAKNSGKTALSLWTAIGNRDHFEVHYFNSEMGEDELKERCENFRDIPFQEWRKISFYPRSDNFQDVIRPGPGKLNIIDFMEVYEDFWITKKWIAQIWKKLDGAIAIVNLQKPHNRDFGWGGEGTIEKARLALAVDKGTLKIVAAKSWKSRENPNGKKITFKIVNGCELIRVDDWSLD